MADYIKSMKGRIFEVLPVPGSSRVVVRDYVPDDSGGELDPHEVTFYDKDRALDYLRNFERVVSDRWKSE